MLKKTYSVLLYLFAFWGSYFHSMKVEAIQYEPFMTSDEMRQTVFEYIEVDYNRTRRHRALGYLSPVNFEQKNVA
ncbi:hypothetical protein VA7868_02435 [Vibrio aerogenes CECT 7868]|uniref:Integrase catalytic domain-containing protein n=1 Tax=Vibrio aerogenes CECT 7868 TaxID=1216006 RepID=A0A1M5Z8M1_9VIBR|nr:hypothetical protein VA7868_02435 [Vibrio aerogenes CECT 7868]